MAGRPDWREAASAIRAARDIERKWLGAVPQSAEDKARNTPWMPFQLFAFIEMLAETLPEINGGRLLEVGCGPGTKMFLAQELFGFVVHGFDVTEEYIEAARALDLDVEVCDALAWDDWGSWDVIWFNRALRGQPQADLEARVWEQAAPGTVVMCANLESRPPASWYPILDSWDEDRRGIWQKPFVSARG